MWLKPPAVISYHSSFRNALLTSRSLKAVGRKLPKAGKPVAKLVPYEQETTLRQLGAGNWHGKIWMADDFDELPEDILQLFTGEVNEDESAP